MTNSNTAFLHLLMKIFVTIVACTLSLPALAQNDSAWTLKQVVEYAMANNINARQMDVQSKNAALTYNQSKLARYPSVSASGNIGLSSGVTQDPITFDRNTCLLYTSPSPRD